MRELKARIEEYLQLDEEILWKKEKLSRNGILKRFCMLTNKRWVQSPNWDTHEYLFGILLHNDGTVYATLEQINAITVFSKWRWIGFIFFYDGLLGEPILGRNNLREQEYNHLLNILVNDLGYSIEKQIDKNTKVYLKKDL